MSILAVSKAVKVLLNSWDAPGVKFVGDNEAEPKNATEWARLSLRPATEGQASMGAEVNTTRHTGAIILSIFVKPGSGNTRIMGLADKAIAALEYKRVLGDGWILQTRAGGFREIGQNAGATYYQVNVTVNYYSDRTA